MFMQNVNARGEVGFVVSKKSGVKKKARLLVISERSPKYDVFVMDGEVVWRDSIRRRYNVA